MSGFSDRKRNRHPLEAKVPSVLARKIQDYANDMVRAERYKKSTNAIARSLTEIREPRCLIFIYRSPVISGLVKLGFVRRPLATSYMIPRLHPGSMTVQCDRSRCKKTKCDCRMGFVTRLNKDNDMSEYRIYMFWRDENRPVPWGPYAARMHRNHMVTLLDPDLLGLLAGEDSGQDESEEDE